ncbi:hypothetical protein GC177_08365 [bacterium]|nr:hypothetical protein [bacterium]
MTNNSWVAKAIGFRADLPAANVPPHEEVVLLLQASNHFGDMIFCYLKLPFEKYSELKEKIANADVVDPRAYGTIVAAGLGKPSEELQQEVAKELGIVSVNLVGSEPTPDRFNVEDVDDYPF